MPISEQEEQTASAFTLRKDIGPELTATEQSLSADELLLKFEENVREARTLRIFISGYFQGNLSPQNEALLLKRFRKSTNFPDSVVLQDVNGKDLPGSSIRNSDIPESDKLSVLREFIFDKNASEKNETLSGAKTALLTQFLQRIAQGNLTEIDKALLLRTFREGVGGPELDNVVLQDENGKDLTGGSSIFRSQIPEGPEFEIVRSLFADQRRFQQEQISIQSQRLTLRAIASDSVSPLEEAKLSGRFRPSTIRPDYIVLLNKEGKPVSGAVPASELPAPYLKEVFNLVNDNSIPEEIRKTIRNFVASGNKAALERVTASLSDLSPQVVAKIKGPLNMVVAAERQLVVQEKFYTALLKERSAENAFRVINELEEDNNEDRALIISLAEMAFSQRRAQLLAKFSSILNSPNSNFDSANQALDPLLKSFNESDKNAGLTFLEFSYKRELEKVRKTVLSKISPVTPPKIIYELINSIRPRPTVGAIDFFAAQIDLKDEVSKIYTVIEQTNRISRVDFIRQSFATKDPSEILTAIDSFPDETEEELALKSQIFILYKNYVAGSKSDVFDQRFAKEIKEKIESRLRSRFISPESGPTRERLQYLRDHFVRTLFPLIEAYRDDSRTSEVLQKLLYDENGRVRNKYLQRLKSLEAQRPLTDNERAYILSVEPLTVYNPYIIAALSANPGVTYEFLRHHFESLSRQTKEKLQDGQYAPLIVIGTGPSGLTALGELARKNPELIRQTLIVDGGEQPGGPFAIPNGPAWELNSANSRGEAGYIMPETPGPNELQTVRAYGSPVARWYPGERIEELDVRQSSINTTVDYFPTPDNLSNQRYPTNEELQAILATQAALLTERIALKTTVTEVKPDPDRPPKFEFGEEGKLVTLEIEQEDGTIRQVQLKTDGLIVSSGLGEPTYGFKLEGSRAQNVLESTKNAPFPKLSVTLEAFRAFADRSSEQESPGKTITIYGGGNSADTLLEYIGSIFNSSNPSVRDVTKVYVVTTKDLSSRPRYAAIADLKPRNGDGNLVEIINSRVSDVGFATETGNAEERELVLYNAKNEIITNSKGLPVKADSVIAAVGFRPNTEGVFSAYFNPGESVKDDGPNSAIQPLTLPTNSEIAVADYLRDDPTILFVGTASKPRFEDSKSLAKLAQLPLKARQALLRNGVENAVAIGFRAPDTQAAVNIWLNKFDVNINSTNKLPLPHVVAVNDETSALSVSIPKTINSKVRIPNNVTGTDNGEQFLTSLLSYNIGNSFELADDFTGNFELQLNYDSESEQFLLNYIQGTRGEIEVKGISSDFMERISGVVSDFYFQEYAQELLKLGTKRKSNKIDIFLSFSKGRINPRNTRATV